MFPLSKCTPPPAGLFLGLLLVQLAREALAQPSLSTILTNGPASNRLNIVVLSEAYTTNQLGQFLIDATNAVNGLLSQPPYSEYHGYFNAFAVAVPSNQSGSDHPANGTNATNFRDTYFNSTYDSTSDRIITIPPNFADTNYSHGQGKVDTLLQTYMPRCHLPMLLVNDPTPGGSDGFDKTAISYNGFSEPDIMTHESGHVLANLGDEYTNAYPGFPNTEEPNTTQQTQVNLIKWRVWINTNSTPIPTPQTSTYGSVIGLFQGAHYHPTNWYRPKLDCAMKDLGVPFCEVCSEALVLSLYQRVRPIDAFAPGATNLTISSTQAVNFSLQVLQPETHRLQVQWFTNAVPWEGATNVALSVYPATLGNGTQTVSVVVNDPTSFVRNDPSNLLSQTIHWTLWINIPQLTLNSSQWLGGGQFSFCVTGNAPQGFALQSSPDLVSWTSLLTNVLVNGQFCYTNSNPAAVRKFFRAVTPPH